MACEKISVTVDYFVPGTYIDMIQHVPGTYHRFSLLFHSGIRTILLTVVVPDCTWYEGR